MSDHRVQTINWGKGLVLLGTVAVKCMKFSCVNTGGAISIMSTEMFQSLSDLL